MVGGLSGPRSVSVRSRICVIALATTALAPPLPSLAQSTPPPGAAVTGNSAAELNPATRVSRPPPRRAAGAFTPEPPGPCPLETSTVEFTLNSVTFRGATAVGDDQLRAAYAEYLGNPQRVSVICAIRDRASQIVFNNGILARIEIPEQRIEGGALVLEVIEAQVVNVRVRGDVGPAQEVVERYAEKLRGMKPFDMAKAQRYLLLASDVPGLRVRAAVRPSTSPERGAVDIDLTVTKDGPDVFANVQNTGSKQVGRWGGLIRGEMASQTRFGESAALTAFRTLESNEQWLVQLAGTARVGAEGAIGRGSLVYGESRPGGGLKPLGILSKSVVGNVEGAYPIIRSRAQNLNIAGGLDLIGQKTSIAGASFSQDDLRIFYARADGDYRTEVAQRPVLFNGGVALRKGVSALGGSNAGDAGLSRASGKPEAWVVKGQGGLDIALSSNLTGMVRAQAQYSSSNLLPYEQISLGGLTVGRGYDAAALLGDKGYSGAFELRYGPLELHPKVVAAPYAFFDAGRVSNNNAAGSGLTGGRTLKSVGAGVVLRVFNRANLEVTYAHPIDSTRVGGRRPSDRVLIQLTASLL